MEHSHIETWITEAINELLKEIEHEGKKYGLNLNRSKCVTLVQRGGGLLQRGNEAFSHGLVVFGGHLGEVRAEAVEKGLDGDFVVTVNFTRKLR